MLSLYNGLGIGVIPAVAIASPPVNTIARSILGLDIKLPVGIVFQSEVDFPGSALHALISDLQAGLKSD